MGTFYKETLVLGGNMNKDKVIKDLKERNDKLVYQLDTTKIREIGNQMKCERLQEAKDKLQKDYQDAVDKIYELQQIIDKAIEYIEYNVGKDNNGCGVWWYAFQDYQEAKDELLDILRGEK